MLDFLHFNYKSIQAYLQEGIMGTIQSKIKNSYQIRSSPIFTNQIKEGVQPIKFSTFTKQKSITIQPAQTNTLGRDEMLNQVDSLPIEEKLQLSTPQLISQSNSYPCSSIGLVSCILDDQMVYGAGFLIGPNLVLTCAHNVWSFRNKKSGSNIIFTSSFQNGQQLVFETKKVHICEELAIPSVNGDQLIPFDFAVIELEGQYAQNELGTLGVYFNAHIAQKSLSLVLFNHQDNKFQVCQLSDRLRSIQNYILKYDLNAGYGMSGSPILQIIDGKFYVVGMHINSKLKNKKHENYGITFGDAHFQYLQKWCMRIQQQIDLREKGVGKQGLKYLSRHIWTNLNVLNLSRNGLEQNISKYLKRGHWKNLVVFDLGGNTIGKEGAQALAQSSMASISTLNLWGNGICKAGAYFLSLAEWQNLTNINLYNNNIGDEGVEFLTRADWTKLNNLNLGKNDITISGAEHLMQGKWANLACLNLWGNKLQGGSSRLKSRFLEHFKLLKFLYL